MAILKSSGLMLELAVIVSLSVSVGRESGTVSMARKTVLASTILPTMTTLDRIQRGGMASGRRPVYFQGC
jgi:hypothetical protein